MSAPSVHTLSALQAQLQTAAQQQQEKLHSLSTQLKNTRRHLQWLTQLQAALQAEAYWQACQLLQAEPAELPDQIHSALLQQVQQAARQAQKRFPACFAAACAAAALNLDTSSQHPRYLLAEGLLQLEIQDTEGLARISTPVSQLARLPADPGPLAAWLAQTLQQWQARPFDPAQFLADLHSAYTQCLSGDQPPGGPVALKTLLKTWSQAERQRRPEYFVLDLLHWLALPYTQQQALQQPYGQLELLQTRNTKSGIYLPLPGRPGYFGGLSLQQLSPP